jgi:D-alanine transaminase
MKRGRGLVYLNGQYLPIEEARIPVLDRGFIFGDGVYEVIPVYSRRPFRLAEHLQRLTSSLTAIRLPNPHADEEWALRISHVIQTQTFEDQSVYLQVTRGVAPRDHVFPQGVPPTVFIMSNPLRPAAEAAVENGVAAITAADNRWLRCDIKSVSLLPNVLLRQLSADVGAAETILLRDGWVTEGSASNVFVVRDGVLLAPPKSHLTLPGITYDVVLELAMMLDLTHNVRRISESELRTADEIWITSSTKEVLAVTTLDGKPVGGGKPGALQRIMFTAYQDYKSRVMRGAV